METSCLNMLFSKRSMMQLADSGTCEAFCEAVVRFVGRRKCITNGEALSNVFSYMKRHYRNEYVYKSLLLKKIVYGRHSPHTTSALCELPVGGSIADFVLINGKACVYEIKTDLDNLVRLEAQIQDYYRAFRFVSVVCSEGMSKSLSKFLEDSPVGLMVLTRNLTFRTLKEPVCCDTGIDSFVQFDLLRKSEREDVILQCGGILPETTQVQYYSACLKAFKKLNPEHRMAAFEGTLKKRGDFIDQEALLLYPEEFRLIAYNHGANVRQAMQLQQFSRSLYR
ncbi:sce7726 family protein [Adlercreutzia murintestinalis]|uniref:sce7726 family protein n=1 Tax=Adlercreutzia murintestinalis TaxID=2941325 RepID=UPI00203D3FAB|nr:sce7726 family protein [Adlercreutzia murintestinalis]